MHIIITGTPGTGKSSVAKELGKLLNMPVIHTTNFVKEHKLGKEVDVRKLQQALLKKLVGKQKYIIEGHLVCEFRLPAEFIFVLRTDPKILKERLDKRKYNAKKLEENLFAEMLDYCTQRIESEYNRKAMELNTSKLDAKKAAERLANAIKKKKNRLDRVNYSKEIEKYLQLK